MKKNTNRYPLSTRIGVKLRELRRQYGMTQERLAEKLEIHPSYVGQLERGEREASLHTLEKLAGAFDVPPEEFINDQTSGDKETLKRECERLLEKCTTAQIAAVHSLLTAFLFRRR